MSISTSESSSVVRTVVGLREGDDGDLAVAMRHHSSSLYVS